MEKYSIKAELSESFHDSECHNSSAGSVAFGVYGYSPQRESMNVQEENARCVNEDQDSGKSC